MPLNDIASINYAEIQVTDTDGVGWSEFTFKWSTGSASLTSASNGANDCVSAYGYGGENADYIWLDIDDSCEKARMEFSAQDSAGDQASEKIYAVTDCNCDKVLSYGFYQTETDDADSCFVFCDV